MQLKRRKEVARLAATALEEHADQVCRRGLRPLFPARQLMQLTLLLGLTFGMYARQCVLAHCSTTMYSKKTHCQIRG